MNLYRVIAIIGGILLGLVANTNIAFSQGFQYRNVPKQIVSNYYSHKSYQKTSRDVYALKYLPSNPRKDGSRDYTAALQKAINNHERIILPNFPIAINRNGLTIPSNRTIVFQPNSTIIYRGPANGRFQDIIKIYDAKNVAIVNAKIVGSKNTKNQSGEWSAGICILNSENVTIENAYIKDAWGDGIFIGSENNGVSRNIKISNVWIDNCRRNAISITSVIRADINNTLVSNTHGTLPECGVDIEPSLFGELIQDVNFNNFYSYNNKNAAFNINLSALNSNEKQYKPEVTININGIYDELSYNFIGLGFNNYDWRFSPRGRVVIKNGRTKSRRHDIELDISKVKTPIKLINEGLQREN